MWTLCGIFVYRVGGCGFCFEYDVGGNENYIMYCHNVACAVFLYSIVFISIGIRIKEPFSHNGWNE